MWCLSSKLLHCYYSTRFEYAVTIDGVSGSTLSKKSQDVEIPFLTIETCAIPTGSDDRRLSLEKSVSATNSTHNETCQSQSLAIGLAESTSLGASELEQFLGTARKFNRELKTSERKLLHDDLAQELRRLKKSLDDTTMKTVVAQVNSELESACSPYRFGTSKGPGGQEFLGLRSRQGVLIATVAIGAATEAPSTISTRKGVSPTGVNLSKRESVWTVPSSTGAKADFFNAGRKFVADFHLVVDRRTAHERLAETFKALRAAHGVEVAQTALNCLNDNLDANGSPFRFNISAATSGKESLCLRDSTGNLIATIAVTKPTREFQRSRVREDNPCETESANDSVPPPVTLRKSCDNPFVLSDIAGPATFGAVDSWKVVVLSGCDKDSNGLLSLSKVSCQSDLESGTSDNDSVPANSVAKPAKVESCLAKAESFSSPPLSIPPGAGLVPAPDFKAGPLLTYQMPESDDGLRWFWKKERYAVEEAFSISGKQFVLELPQDERYAAHLVLADLLAKINDCLGDEAVGTSIEHLNRNLEINSSQFRFSVAKMSNGQKFLTLRDMKGRLIGTIPFTQAN